MDTPSITLYDKNFVELGYISAPNLVTGSLRHNAISSLQVSLASDHELAGPMTRWGARITVDYLGEQIFSGPMRKYVISSGGDGLTTATFEDDIRLLWRLLAWPDPSQPVTNQKAREYDRSTGSAETVLKDILRRNLARPGWVSEPIDIAPDLGRGPRVTVLNRFHNIAERTLPRLDEAGLGVEVRQRDGRLVVDVYEPRQYGPELVAGESGAVVEWVATQEAPSATRGVVGGSGEGVDRQFLSWDAPVRENEWADRIEVFTDARMTETAEDLQDSVDEAVSEGHEKTGIRVTLLDTDEFRYGGTGGIRRGDIATIRIGPLVRTDVIREANVTWNAEDGMRITPTIGEVAEDIQRKLMRQVVLLSRRMTRLSNR